jgi:hypothetical protein
MISNLSFPGFTFYPTKKCAADLSSFFFLSVIFDSREMCRSIPMDTSSPSLTKMCCADLSRFFPFFSR